MYATDSVKLALYDLCTDPGETLDMQEQYPEIVKQLTDIADIYRKELGNDLTKQTGTEVRPAAKVTF
jgi:arylsulfatase